MVRGKLSQKEICINHYVQKGHHVWMSRHKWFKHRNIISLECWNWAKEKAVWWRGNWRNWKNGCYCVNMHHMETFQITDPSPSKFRSLFSTYEKFYEKFKNWPPFHEYVLYRKNWHYWPPSRNSAKFGSLAYPTSDLCLVLDIEN